MPSEYYINYDGVIIDFTEANATTDLFSLKNINSSDKQQWYKKCWHDGTI